MTREELEKLPESERIAYLKQHYENKIAALFGTPEERESKNRVHVAEMVALYTEPVIRAILKVLSEVDKDERFPRNRDLVFPKILRRHNLDTDPLDQIIRYYAPNGPRVQIRSHKGNEYHVLVDGGWGLAMQCWSGDVWRLGSRWCLKDSSYFET